jgi:hypothetical protein
MGGSGQKVFQGKTGHIFRILWEFKYTVDQVFASGSENSENWRWAAPATCVADDTHHFIRIPGPPSARSHPRLWAPVGRFGAAGGKQKFPIISLGSKDS